MFIMCLSCDCYHGGASWLAGREGEVPGVGAVNGEFVDLLCELGDERVAVGKVWKSVYSFNHTAI